MSFLSEESAAQKVGLVLGIIVIGLVARMVMAGGIEEYFNPAKRVENRIVEVMEEHPGDLIILQTMRDYFPHEYEDLLDAMSDVAVAGAPPEVVIAAGNRELAAFLHRHKNDFGNAPSDSLDAALDAELALLQALRGEDPGACSAYAYGIGLFEGEPSPATLELLGNAIASKVRAMYAGRTNQQIRFDLVPHEIEAWNESMMALGASEAQAIVARVGSDEFVMDDGQRCQAAIYALEATRQQDRNARDLLTGALLTVAEPA